MSVSPSRAHWWLVFLWLGAACASNTWSQEDLEEEPPEFQPGLIAEIQVQGGESFKRLDQDVVFDWNAQSIDPRADPRAEFNVRWSGFLECKENGEFRLHALASGVLRVRLDDREVLRGEAQGDAENARWLDSLPIDLKFGRHRLEIDFVASGPRRQLGLYWSGPQFEVEPISQRSVSHRAADAVDGSFERGSQLSRALRCAACHAGSDVRKPLRAPSLTHLQGNLHRRWLVERLTATNTESTQRMPHYGLEQIDAQAIAMALFDASEPSAAPPRLAKPKLAKGRKDDPPARTEPSVAEGKAAFLALGCLACHQLGELGDAGLFDGGNLSRSAAKRPADFHARWLEDPSRVNLDHRMPVFELEPLQRADLAAFLQSLGQPESDSEDVRPSDRNELVRGQRLIAEHRCGACHLLPGEMRAEVRRSTIDDASDWEAGCLRASDPQRSLPGFGLSSSDRAALRLFWKSVNRSAIALGDGRQLMVEQNCVACHARDAATGLSNTLAKLATLETAVAPRLAAFAPPSLTGVGDKLHETALAAVLAGKDPPRRPWLDVRMPKFRLNEVEIGTIVRETVTHDRIPDLHVKTPELPGGKATELAGARLVTAEGFGCQSCHRIGDVESPNVALHARGTDLTLLGARIRPSWFRRWVHNPSRIVPRMEMPAIQVAVKGVLRDDLDLQLAALWKTLNTPGFEPPKPNPVRVVRNLNIEGEREHANVLTDVLETPRGKYLRPLIVGLPNRHNALWDLESGRLTSWWIGDTARQYTRGKSWYWEAGAPSIVEELEFLQQFSIVDSNNRKWSPRTNEQFVVQFDRLKHIDGGIEWGGRIELQHEGRSRFVKMTQRWVAAGGLGLDITIALEGLEDTDQVVIEAVPMSPLSERSGAILAELNENATASWRSPQNLQIMDGRRLSLQSRDASQRLQWTMNLSANLPVDRLQAVSPPLPVASAQPLDVVPGYFAIQLPLPRNEMPTALAWRESGEMFVASLKGRVLKVVDANADGLGDAFEVVSDDLPAPYGLAVNADSVDVLCKTSLIRLSREETAEAFAPYSQTVVADGWGYTADYHDWAVGLQRDAEGSYYMALPCQQDDRSEAAAKMRGQALKLVPYQSPESPRAYRIEPVAAGLRFPMGLALSSRGDLFATDNQGNYNPFNELNHIQLGKRYGFINKLEAKPNFSPAFESPAVNLPHPWTRSVNGLCFLETPKMLVDQGRQGGFGPHEGDLVGCEYNGLSLIRMSLQKVGDQYQGAAYAFSRPPAEGGATFEGPVCCAVGPGGDLFVGSIHDSGWGGGQNTGSIVRLRADAAGLPLGIDEVRATPTGLEIHFTQPVDAQRAVQTTHYNIRSYRRVSTPAYGGDDQAERSEGVRSLRVSEDLKTVTLELDALRAGCMYEVNVGAVGAEEQAMFPSQAHYHMRAVPQ